MSKEYSTNHTQQLYNRYLNLALNRFTWNNLPIGITSRKIEEMLVKNGQVMFFNDNGVFIALPCFGVGMYDVYGEPITYNVVGNNYNKNIDRDKGVVIRNNATATNDHDDLLLFAERINEVEQTMDVNLNAQKTPYVILCDEKERLTFKNILNQVNKFKYAIFGAKGLKINNVDILQTKADFLLDKLQDTKNALMNELLTFLGINNSNTDKKERLLVDEVNSNNDFIMVNIDHMFEERKKAVEEINRIYGLNIVVEKREVEINGDLYNGTKTNIER